MEKNRDLKNKIPIKKKDIKTFLFSEEGKVLKKNVVKTCMSLAFLSLMAPTIAAAHNNYYTFAGSGGHVSHSSHGSHASHASHGSHSSHGHGAW